MKRIRAVLILLAAVFFVSAAPALASAEPNAVKPGTVGGVTLNAFAVTMLVSLLLPVVTGIVTKYSAPAIVKSLVALAVSSINGVVMGGLAVDGTAHIAKAAIMLAVLSFAIQTATYLGVYKPNDVNAALGQSFGIGPRD